MNQLEIEILSAATAEAKRAKAWYAERSFETAAAFEAELRSAVERIRSDPERWPVYLRGTRRILLHTFPYLVVYRLLSDRILIVAIAHAHRRAGYWKSRKGQA
jgi:plasmid stabilization system protein ParE